MTENKYSLKMCRLKQEDGEDEIDFIRKIYRHVRSRDSIDESFLIYFTRERFDAYAETILRSNRNIALYLKLLKIRIEKSELEEESVIVFS